MRKKNRDYCPLVEADEMSGSPDYSVQATPLVIRDLGWDTLREISKQAYKSFDEGEFMPLVVRDGGWKIDTKNDTMNVFIILIREPTDKAPGRSLMVFPYRDTVGIRVLYCKWTDETLEDSVAVPDGQNKVLNNTRKQK